jgi:hypothetical protein
MTTADTPRISVCIATYNGEQWVASQLRSVLEQLDPADEVILVDDGSSDTTIERVRALADSRIHIFQNERNIGVDATFEKALGLARGSFLFLCDQDDLWCPNKVRRVMQVFNQQPEVTLVLSDAQLIDGNDQVIASSYFGIRGAFVPGVMANILKSKFLGCAMAFRSSLRERFLPFPHPIPGHDMWIGVINEFYGCTFFIEEPLICYRRHGRNASPLQRQSLKKMLAWRWQLIVGLVRKVSFMGKTTS